MTPSDSLPVEPVSLSVSCVTYNLDKTLVSNTLHSLAKACDYARAQRQLKSVHLYLIDNGPGEQNRLDLLDLQQLFQQRFDQVTLISGHGNPGYGAGHNLAIHQASSAYHLVLNPDVVIAENNLSIALGYMNHHPDVGLLAPDAVDETGARQYLAKRMPSFLVLLSRAANIRFLRKRLAEKLYRYEYRDQIPATQPVDITLASGCYMFLRTPHVQRIGGFDPDFFMYFEDFDLSRRIASFSRVVHHPTVKIVHYGGGASRKGFRHLRYFFVSYLRFIYKNN